MAAEAKGVHEVMPNVVPLWEVFSTLIPAGPGSMVEPFVWNGKEILSELKRLASDVKIGGDVERRVLVPVNPGLKKLGLYTATHTIYVGFQIVLPGEVAGAHRHTPWASRFMIKGEAWTTVDGTEVSFKDGDFITTPRWAFHDHANRSNEPAVWMDALDTPIPKFMLASFFQDYGEEVQPVMQGDLHARVASTGVTPSFSLDWSRAATPPLKFAWEDTYGTLKDLARITEGSPYEGVTVTLRDPRSGREVSPALGADMTLLKGGTRTKSHRHTMSVVYYVVRGKGSVKVEGKVMPWSENDIISLTPWAHHELANEGPGEAVLFSLNDRPLLGAMGLYREEPEKK
jgi:gentisate 1,2-dioxygenase